MTAVFSPDPIAKVSFPGPYFGGGVFALAWSSDERFLAAGCKTGEVRVLDSNDFSTLRSLVDDKSPVHALAWHPEDGMLVIARANGMVCRWKPQPSGAHDVSVLTSHKDKAYSVAMTADGTRLATAGFDESVQIWELSQNGRWTREASNDFAGQRSTVKQTSDPGGMYADLSGKLQFHQAAWSPDGEQLALVGNDGFLRVLSQKSKRVTLKNAHQSSWIFAVAWSHDGSRLVTGGADNTIRIWDTSSWTQVGRLEHHSDWVTSLDWSPGGDWIASASRDDSIAIWDLSKRTVIQVLGTHRDGARAVRWSPTGAFISSAGFDSEVKVWTLA